ncbi:hypothetical protein BDIM_10100 [Brevundimonas diminuta ATCC 11568]|nr:hypothetical protein BDIM_10100 [Brevundimonas diminuta ATCC 11568]
MDATGPVNLHRAFRPLPLATVTLKRPLLSSRPPPLFICRSG